MNNKKEAGSSAAKLQNSLLFSIRDHKRLLLRDVFADIQCDRYDDNDTLYNVLIVGRDSKELHGGFQQLEYENTDDNTGDTADTTVYGYMLTLAPPAFAPRRKPAIAYRAAAVT